ncbi:hypothetical protein [Butyrivibrio sp. VCD2006]|uniref:hypothetical protein n=1 Tax=Butyrivibrio sp. VCD2006 TaxID=1280664 RepID=UPI00047B610B|nr:hypothetical protein [Butyrivibrio sp. VCD2006]
MSCKEELINQYIQHQEEVDDELKERLNLFRENLQESIEVFDGLISDAFSSDISKRLMASVSVSRNAGVDEAEILDSVEKIDDFFM